MVRCTSHVFNGSAVALPDGTTAKCTFVANHFPDEAVTTWQMLEIFLAVIGRSPRLVDASKLIRDSKPSWEVLLAAAGLTFDQCVHRPRRALEVAARAGEQVPDTCLSRDGWSADTAAVLAWLLFMSKSSRKYRAEAQAVLAQFLTMFVKMGVFDSVIGDACEASFGECTDAASEHGECRHMRPVIAAAESQRCPVTGLCQLLKDLASHVHGCRAAAACLTKLLAGLSAHVHTHLDTQSAPSPLKADHLGHVGGRKRHYREAFKNHVAVVSLEQPQGAPGHCMVKADGIDTKRHRDWSHIDMCTHVFTNRRRFGASQGTFCQSEDAARLGKPALEVKTYLIFHPESGEGTWLANQAPRLQRQFNS